jgi:hypothetical protein
VPPSYIPNLATFDETQSSATRQEASGCQQRTSANSTDRTPMNELLHANLGDLRRSEDGAIIHVCGKGGEDRRIPIRRRWSQSSSIISKANGCVSQPPPRSAPPPAGDLLVMKVQVDQICDAIKSALPQEMWVEIIEMRQEWNSVRSRSTLARTPSMMPTTRPSIRLSSPTRTTSLDLRSANCHRRHVGPGVLAHTDQHVVSRPMRAVQVGGEDLADQLAIAS